MNGKTIAALGLPAVLLTAWCGLQIPGPVADEVYVVTPAEKASSFATYLASVVKKRGMTPNLGQATDDHGYSVYVLDATSPLVRLRSENVLLSGQEDDAMCGAYAEPHSDPGQYFISVGPATQMTGPGASRELLEAIVNDLKVAGYDVRDEPIVCSPQSRSERRN